MSLRPAYLAALPLLLAACGEDAVAPESLAAACPLHAPVRLAAPPDGWQPGPARVYPFKQLGDRLLYSFDDAGDPDPGYWLIHRCGGAPRRFTTFTPGTVLPFSLETAEGTLVYAVDREGRHVVLDRLDVPGFDVPRPVGGLPGYDVPGGSPHEAGYALFASVNRPTGAARQAAGVEAGTAVVHTHDGDPDAPALLLGDNVVSLAQHGGHVFVLDDDGVLRKVDPFTREREPLQDGVRYFTLAGDGRHLIWQAIGDDDVEPVYLRDLEVRARVAVADFGVDREIAVNDFAARSWNRMPDQDLAAVGRWTWTGDSTAAALVGPDGTFVTAVRTDTGEPLAIPEHRGQRGALGDDFVLVMPDEGTLVLALWHPTDGDLRVWYRGPADATVEAGARVGDELEYFLADPTDETAGSLLRVDLGTGELTERAPRIGRDYRPLDAHRYFTAVRAEPVQAGAEIQWTYDLLVFDADTRVYTTIAERVDDFVHMPDQGVLYLDSRGDEPGLWAAPLASH
ncbi:hypothetical protein SAMN02745121_01653 [Nannocystis exedens]|uniref:Uncharacterized protein n=1 Tax=Nannocystis exedens TaxID=54 RepID=A0A1I1VAH8_9BACT|nr:hypothetical protein [Nannocystis exedens]PCC72476.1 hypothetical protein NAEX_05556 [Nannocystis exedens]SFD79815.1 hypothetical protein SAMN02745121_01653 [Nannocystis exedens]